MVARMKTDGFIEHLKAWGLNVDEVKGWQTRGRPYNFYPKAIIAHHDASSISSGNQGALNLVINGRPGLSGPLSQFVLCRDGKVVVVAAGYANHAGIGGPRAGVPQNAGNTYCLGIEACNNGVGEKWPAVQLNAYYRLCAALMSWLGLVDVNCVFGHKEWTSRKIDPYGLNMNVFRANVEKALVAGPSVPVVRLGFVPGQKHPDTPKIKDALRKRGFFKGKNNTQKYGKAIQNAYSAYQRSLGYTGSSADGIPGTISLRKLGFVVVA